MNLDATIFTHGQTPYLWRDAVIGAVLRGKWSEVEADVVAGIAAEQRTANDLDPIGTEDLQEAANAFRIDSGLTAGAELRVWLDRWDLTPEAWLAQIRRNLLLDAEDDAEDAADAAERASAAAAALAPPAGATLPDAELSARLTAAGATNGHFDGYIDALATRVAASAIGAREIRRAQHDELVEQFATRLPASTVLGLRCRAFRDAIARHVDLELGFVSLCDAHAGPAAVATAIREHHRDWVRCATMSLAVARESVAREAALCVRHDGMSLEDAARAAGVDVQPYQFLLEELDAAAQNAVLRANLGDTVGPLVIDDTYVLLRLIDTRRPDPGDPELVGRARNALLDPILAQALDDHVEWPDD